MFVVVLVGCEGSLLCHGDVSAVLEWDRRMDDLLMQCWNQVPSVRLHWGASCAASETPLFEIHQRLRQACYSSPPSDAKQRIVSWKERGEKERERKRRRGREKEGEEDWERKWKRGREEEKERERKKGSRREEEEERAGERGRGREGHLADLQLFYGDCEAPPLRLIHDCIAASPDLFPVE